MKSNAMDFVLALVTKCDTDPEAQSTESSDGEYFEDFKTGSDEDPAAPTKRKRGAIHSKLQRSNLCRLCQHSTQRLRSMQLNARQPLEPRNVKVQYWTTSISALHAKYLISAAVNQHSGAPSAANVAQYLERKRKFFGNTLHSDIKDR